MMTCEKEAYTIGKHIDISFVLSLEVNWLYRHLDECIGATSYCNLQYIHNQLDYACKYICNIEDWEM